MIISKYYNSLSKEKKENLLSGLLGGLFWGLVGGLLSGLLGELFWGLVGGLLLGLLWGLLSGLLGGLLWGLFWGLVVILINYSEAFPFLTQFWQVGLIIFGIIILAEILFWLDNQKPEKKEDTFYFTLRRKAENIFEVLLGLSGISQIYILFREIQIKQYLPEILKWIGYIGAGIIAITFICFAFYLWIKLNELKYKK